MDRNPCFILIDVKERVALRKESVDRNYRRFRTIQHPQVALRKESVDRNLVVWAVVRVCESSLSARRAWIEISTVIVILRKRNSRSPQGERG